MDRADVKILPPVVLAVGLGLEILAGFLLPTRLFPDPVAISLGFIVIAASITLVVLAVREIVHANTAFDARKSTTAIVETGVFRFTRNPVYLSMILLGLGVGLMLNSPWALLLTYPLGSALCLTAIRPEESYLEAKFGHVYRAYRERVPRWFSPKQFVDTLRNQTLA